MGNESLHIEEVTTLHEFLLLEERWNDLFRRDRDAHIYQSFGWHKAYWEALGSEAQLSILIATHNDRAVAIFPGMKVVAQAEGLSLNRVSLIGGDFSADYVSPIIDSQISEELRQELLQLALQQWSDSSLIEFFNLRKDSVLFTDLLNSERAFAVPLYSSWQCSLDKNDPESLIRRKSLKKSVRRIKRKLDYSVAHFTDANKITAQLDEFFALHCKRWKKSDPCCQFNNPAQQELYHNFTKYLCPKKQILFSTVRDQDTLVAAHFGFWFNNILYFYKSAHDPDYEECSPGTALLYESGVYAAENGGTLLDFTVGDEPYKQRYATSRIQMYRLRIPNRPWLAHYFRTLNAMRTAKQRLLSTNVLNSIFITS
ncbi:MAG: GNAT family N-acetyltransferase [Bdellovibrionales bacterium]|nr:GNAT family N-acetyltransferase [Bdellovibrionales bacterium]